MKRLFLILFILGNISLIVAQDTWESIIKDKGYSYQKSDFAKVGVYTPTEAKRWLDAGIHDVRDISEYKKIGIKTLKEYKPYSKLGYSVSGLIIGAVSHARILKSLKIKPNTLIISMSKSNIGFKSKKDFLSMYKFLKRNKCKTIEPNFFNYADEYDNKGKCYLFAAEMYQRLDRTHGLAINKIGRSYGNIFYAVFDKSWRDGEGKVGYIKGLGNYKYQTSGGSMKNVSKGKILKFGF